MASLLRLLVTCLILSWLPGCNQQELQQENERLSGQVSTLEMELDRSKRDLDLKEKTLASLTERLQEAEAALSASRLGVKDPKDRLYARIKTNHGEIVSELYWRQTPITVQNFVELAEGKKTFVDPASGERTQRPFYEGLTFHRVIPNFMIQGGDPKGNGSGGPGYTFKDEIVDDLGFSRPGLLAMANRGPNTNGSQFFITTGTPNYLNGKHTIFGEVVKGMEVAEEISKVKTGPRDAPAEPVVIESVTIERRPASEE